MVAMVTTVAMVTCCHGCHGNMVAMVTSDGNMVAMVTRDGNMVAKVTREGNSYSSLSGLTAASPPSLLLKGTRVRLLEGTRVRSI